MPEKTQKVSNLGLKPPFYGLFRRHLYGKNPVILVLPLFQCGHFWGCFKDRFGLMTKSDLNKI